MYNLNIHGTAKPPDLHIDSIRLKPRASKYRGPPVKMYTIFNTVIGLPHLCCHKVLYFLNNTSVIFLAQLHSISEYCIISNTIAVPDIDKERPWTNPLVRPLPIPHLHNWRKMEVCLINFNKGKDDEGCLKLCNIMCILGCFCSM
jgi:hypothetical protein